MANTNKRILSKTEYKKIKRYNRAEMELFISKVYFNGIEDGKNSLSLESVKTLLRTVLKDVDGVGPTITSNILTRFDEMIDMAQRMESDVQE